MEKSKRLCWAPTKHFTENGIDYRISIEVSLHDDCKNGHCDFHLTGSVYKYGHRNPEVCGCIHEEIEKYFPELRKFIPLHLCNYLGHPSYPEANGQYFIKHEGKEVAMRYLRITSDEFSKLSAVGDKEERPYFKYLLYKLGIVDRWKTEADEFIAFLEEKTGMKWENPYAESGERNVMHLTDEERESIEKAVALGYYTPQAIEERVRVRHQAIQQAKRDEVIKRYEEETRKAREERDVKLYIFDSGLPIDNVIYYDHTKKVVFNWLDFKPQISQEDFVDFLNSVDYSKLPKGVTFEIKQK